MSIENESPNTSPTPAPLENVLPAINNQSSMTIPMPQIFVRWWEKLDPKINPICLLELRTTLRKSRFFILFLITLLLSILVLSMVLLVAIADRASHDQLGKTLYMTFFILQLILVNLVFPAFTCTAIISEQERKTYELLITSDLTSTAIIQGKFLSAFIYIFLFLIAMAPLMIISFLFGGITILLIVLSYIGLGLLAALVTFISLWCSVFFKHSTPAMLGSYILNWILSGVLSPLLGTFVGSYLFDNDLSTFFSESWTIHHMMCIVMPIWGMILCIFLPYISAINRIKTPAEYLQTINIRTYFISAMVLTTIFVSIWYFYTMNSFITSQTSVYRIRDTAYTYSFVGTGLMAVLLALAGCGLPMQAKIAHINLIQEWEKQKQEGKFVFLSWLLRPGAISGATLTCIMSLIIFGIITYTTAASCHFFVVGIFTPDVDFNHPFCFFNFPAMSFAFIFFVSFFSAYLRLKFEKKGIAWVILILCGVFIIILIPMFPLFYEAMYRRYETEFWHLGFLSPILAGITAIFDLYRLRSHRINWLLFDTIPLFIPFTIFYFSLGCIFLKNSIKLHQQAVQEAILHQRKIEELQKQTLNKSAS